MSRIEQLIGEIEEYIDSCKFQPLSNTKILVNKEEVEELLVELRLRIPDEIKKYQKIISNQEAILKEAKIQANSMIQEATAHTNDLVNEHEIVQQAQLNANQIIEEAQNQAQAIVNNAYSDADSIRHSAMQYTDELLGNVQAILHQAMDGAQNRFESFYTSMQSSYEIVSNNRDELANGLSQAGLEQE